MRILQAVFYLKPARLRQIRPYQWLTVFTLLLTVYEGWRYNVLEYALTTPFSAFEYPLEIDMENLVDRLERGESAGVEPINRVDYPYVLNCEDRCHTDDGGSFESIFALLVIKSAVGNAERREMIRRTWGDENAASPVSLRRVFVLGVHPDDRALQGRIGAESAKYGDIVQRYFVDDYYNNTLKLRTGFEWAMAHCEGAQFLAFLDDDYYLSPINMVSWLRRQPTADAANAVMGYVWRHAMPIRQRDSKWYVSLGEYPFRFWPPYAAAGSLFVPIEAARRIAAAMPYIKDIRFDDVYIGIICWKLKIEFRGSRRILFDKGIVYTANYFHNLVAAHGFGDPLRLLTVWREQEDYWKSQV